MESAATNECAQRFSAESWKAALHRFFNQVQQVDDGFTSAFEVLDFVRIELVQHNLCLISVSLAYV